MKNLIFAFFFVSLNYTLTAQFNTFNNCIFYPTYPSSPPTWAYSSQFALTETKDFGFILCRGVYELDSCKTEIIRLDSLGQILWSKKASIGTLSDSINIGNGEIIETKDKGFLCATSSYLQTKTSRILLIKTDSLGNITMAHEYPGEGMSVPFKVLQTADNGYLVCGITKNTSHVQYAYIFKTDVSGNYLWGNKYQAGSDTIAGFNSINKFGNNRIIACGYSNNHSLIVYLDANGNKIWDKELVFSKYQSAISDIMPSADNHIIACGSFQDSVLNTSNVCIFKLDTLGNLIWAKADNPNSSQLTNYYANSSSVTNATSNGFLLSGYIQDPIPALTVAKIDWNGNFIWSKTYRSLFESFSNTSVSIINTHDKGIAISELMGTYRNDSAVWGQALLKLDSTGFIPCDGNNLNLTLKNLTISSLSNFNVSSCGFTYPFTISFANSLPKDSIFCSAYGIGIDKIKKSENNFLIYPNPSSGAFTISVFENIREITVTDMLGRIIYQTTTNATKTEVTINNSGVYTIKVNIGGKINTSKIIISKN